MARSLLHSALVQVHHSGQQKSRRPHGASGTALTGTVCSISALSLAPRCCPFPVSSTVAVVNAPLAQRITHYIASPKSTQTGPRLGQARVPGQLTVYYSGCQPSGVGRLNVSAACVERATTIRTGSSCDMFISTCTRCGGTHTKSPVCASCAWSSWSPE